MAILKNWRAYLLNIILATALIFIVFQLKLCFGNSFEISLRPLAFGIIVAIASGAVMCKWKRPFFAVMATIGIVGWYLAPSLQDSTVSSFLGGVGVASVLISSYLLVRRRPN